MRRAAPPMQANSIPISHGQPACTPSSRTEQRPGQAEDSQSLAQGRPGGSRPHRCWLEAAPLARCGFDAVQLT